MRRFTLLLLVLWSIVTASAQNGAGDPWPPEVEARERILRLQRDLSLRQLQDGSSQVARQVAERRAAQFRQRDFEEKANRFVAIWNKFMGEYKKQQTLNIKEARALSKAFRDLETTGWPK
jgi:hypothetical protein